MKSAALACAVAMGLAGSPAMSARCILPPLDTEVAGQAAPAASGVITHVRGTRIEIQPRKGRRQAFTLAPAASIATVYGGDLRREQLKPGQYAYLWLKDCAYARRAAPVVLVKICALDNERC